MQFVKPYLSIAAILKSVKVCQYLTGCAMYQRILLNFVCEFHDVCLCVFTISEPSG